MWFEFQLCSLPQEGHVGLGFCEMGVMVPPASGGVVGGYWEFLVAPSAPFSPLRPQDGCPGGRSPYQTGGQVVPPPAGALDGKKGSGSLLPRQQ